MNRFQLFLAAGAVVATALPGALVGSVARADDTAAAAVTINYPVAALAGMTCTGFVQAAFRDVTWKPSAGTFAIVTIDADVTDENTPGTVTIAADSTCLPTQDPHLLDAISAAAKSKGDRYLEGLSIGSEHFGSAVSPA